MSAYLGQYISAPLGTNRSELSGQPFFTQAMVSASRFVEFGCAKKKKKEPNRRIRGPAVECPFACGTNQCCFRLNVSETWAKEMMHMMVI